MIGFDIDDTVFDLYSVVRTYFFAKYKYDIHPRLEYTTNILDLSDKDMIEHIRVILTDYNDAILPYCSAIPTLEKFYKITKQPIQFITSRFESVFEPTLELLNRHMTIPYELHFTPSHRKKYIVQELELKYFVDDRMSIIKSCIDVCDKTFLMNRTWNLSKDTPKNITRVDNLIQVYNYIRSK